MAKLRILSGGSDHPNDVLPENSRIEVTDQQLLEVVDCRNDQKFKTLAQVDANGNINLGMFFSYPENDNSQRITVEFH